MAARPMTALEWALLILLSLAWGGSFLFVGVAVKALPPLTIVFLRCAIAALALFIAIRMLGHRLPRHGTALVTFIGMGLLNNVIPQSLITWAQGFVPSGYASILNATAPFFTVLILHVATADERATPAKIIGVGLGFFGVAVMIGLDIASHGVGLLPQLALLIAAFFYGLAGWWSRRITALGVAPMVAATGQLLASSIILLPLSLIVETSLALPVPGTAVIASVLALGLVSTALAYIVFFRVLASAGPTNLSLVTFLIPVSAIILGIAFLGEALYPRHIFGMALIGLGLAVIDGRPLAAFRRGAALKR